MVQPVTSHFDGHRISETKKGGQHAEQNDDNHPSDELPRPHQRCPIEPLKTEQGRSTIVNSKANNHEADRAHKATEPRAWKLNVYLRRRVTFWLDGFTAPIVCVHSFMSLFVRQGFQLPGHK